MKSTMDDYRLSIKPSRQLIKYINKLKSTKDMPVGIENVRSKQKLDVNQRKETKHELFINKNDLDFIESLKLDANESIIKNTSDINDDIKANDKLLNLEDLYWLRNKISEENETGNEKVYFHELFEGSKIIFPKNKDIPRNEELEKRCQKLKHDQENRIYHSMTKNVDNVRQYHPEDTISYQMKQINRHLIAIAQFILSVLAGFAFGFIGVELIIGKLDFGFRLLLGIICSLVIALAELYFLAKKLNEDLEFEIQAKKPPTVTSDTSNKTKVD